jgi:hypothetical protein
MLCPHVLLITAVFIIGGIWTIGGIILTGENGNTGRSSCPTASLSFIYFT